MGSNSRSPRTFTSSIGGTSYPGLRNPVNGYDNTYGISIPKAQKIAKQIGKDHMLAG